VVIGRDARLSGDIVSRLVAATLQSLGIDVIDLGLSTTHTVEFAVPLENAGGGIILTASHNPAQWNALKLLNTVGEFISDAEGKAIIPEVKARRKNKKKTKVEGEPAEGEARPANNNFQRGTYQRGGRGRGQ
jgi:phosphomannomutase